MDDQYTQTRKGGVQEPNSEQAPTDKPVTTATESQVPKALTPEEQMALYEKELKENDWGHQPC